MPREHSTPQQGDHGSYQIRIRPRIPMSSVPFCLIPVDAEFDPWSRPYTDWLDYILSQNVTPLVISTSYGDDEQTGVHPCCFTKDLAGSPFIQSPQVLRRGPARDSLNLVTSHFCLPIFAKSEQAHAVFPCCFRPVMLELVMVI